MKKIQFKYNNDNTNEDCVDDSFIHADNPIDSEHSLCGLAFDGGGNDSNYAGQCFVDIHNKIKITCIDCIAIIKHCRSIYPLKFTELY